MKIAIMGTGGVGGYYGGLLAQAGHEVTFILPPSAARACRSEASSAISGCPRRRPPIIPPKQESSSWWCLPPRPTTRTKPPN